MRVAPLGAMSALYWALHSSMVRGVGERSEQADRDNGDETTNRHANLLFSDFRHRIDDAFSDNQSLLIHHADWRCCSNCRGSKVKRRRPNRGFTVLLQWSRWMSV